MSRSALRVALCLGLAAGPAAAQSSQFGVRGLGMPVKPLSVRSFGSGGAFALFDQESGFNPASFGLITRVEASFQTVQSWRNSSSPAGTASARDNRYPGVMVAGPVGSSRFALSLSASGYTDRNFTLASRDTLTLRGVPVETLDTLISLGGLSDLRGAIAWAPTARLQLGLGLHMITGSNRIESRRSFADTAYAGATERFTVSYLGFGISAGAMARVSRVLSVSGMIRYDNQLRVERDSTFLAETRLPLTMAAGLRLQMTDRLLGAAYGVRRTWSRSDDDIVEQGGIGADDTAEFGIGIERLSDPRRPSHRPIRLGFRRGSLPFPLERGREVTETALTLGTGFRFVGDRAGIDLAVERVWRNGGEGFKETATLLRLGVSVRP
jgi:hypothetical protein